MASLSIGKWTLSCIMLLCWDHLLCSPVLHGVKYLPEGWKAEGLVDSFLTAACEPAPLPGHKAFPAWHRCFFCLVGKKWVRRRLSVFVRVGHILARETEARRGDLTCLKLFSGLDMGRAEGWSCSFFTQAPLQDNT